MQSHRGESSEQTTGSENRRCWRSERANPALAVVVAGALLLFLGVLFATVTRIGMRGGIDASGVLCTETPTSCSPTQPPTPLPPLPVIYSDQKLSSSNRVGTKLGFGRSVALEGDVFVVGAPGAKGNGEGFGSAYVFVRRKVGGKRNWVNHARLVPSDPGPGRLFGFSVAIFAGHILVGAPGDVENEDVGGAVYIFAPHGSSWTQQTKLKASDATSHQFTSFGFSVAMDGNTVAIGAWGDNNPRFSGAVYVFTRTSDKAGWSHEAKLKSPKLEEDQDFGQSISLQNNTLVVGSDQNQKRGSVHVYGRSVGTSSSIWSLVSTLHASDFYDTDMFGVHAVIDGDYIFVCAEQGAGEYFGSGALYIFNRTKIGTWIPQTKLDWPNSTDELIPGPMFCSSIAVSGRTAVVGAQLDTDDEWETKRDGSAFVYERDEGNVWRPRAKLKAKNAIPGRIFGAFFGTSVVVDEKSVLVGASGDHDSGSIFAFHDLNI